MTEDFPDDENGDVLRSMAADGVELSSPRIVDFEHVFSSEPFASEFASAVAHLVDKVVRFEPEPDGDGKLLWDVQCRYRMIPTHENISRLEQLLGQKAAEFGGRADGWGSLSNPDGSPAG